MNLFKRKRCCSELIAIKNGNLVFKLSNTHINASYNTLQAIMRKSGIFDENLYFDVYQEYRKHYAWFRNSDDGYADHEWCCCTVERKPGLY